MSDVIYCVRTGRVDEGSIKEEFTDVIRAMEFADFLHTQGFNYAEVATDRLVEYYVEYGHPMDIAQREGRRLMAEDFARNWNSQARLGVSLDKRLQDAAYDTYRSNIQFTKDLDMMFARV